MKKISILLLIGLIIIICASCSQKKFKVAILLYDQSDTFINELNESIVQKIKDLEIIYEVYDGKNSQSIQNQQISSLIDQGIDLLIINPVDRTAAVTICQKAASKQVGIIFINREPLKYVIEQYKNIYYVGSDAQNVGRLQAKIAEIFFQEPTNLNPLYDKNQDGFIQYAVIKGEQGHQDAEDRTRYNMVQLIEDNYKTELLATKIANWKRESGYQAMNYLYQQYQDKIELIFANNDDMALGVIDYLIDHQLIDYSNNQLPFLLISVDGTKVGIDAVEKELLTGTVINSSDIQGQMIVSLVNKMLFNVDFVIPDTIKQKDQFFYDQGRIYLKS